MAQPKTLTPSQVAVLRWISEGCPPGVYEGTHHRISAASLRQRGLVTTTGRGPSWIAKITPAGRKYLKWVDGANPPQLRREPEKRPQGEGDEKSDAAPRVEPATVPVPASLDGADVTVRRTTKALERGKPDSAGLVDAGGRGQFVVAVSPDKAQATALALSAIAIEVKRRGWKLEPNELGKGKRCYGAAIGAGDLRYWVCIEEQCDRQDFTEAEIDAWRNEKWQWDPGGRAGKLPGPQLKRRLPNGRLRYTVTAGTRERQHAFNDTPRFGPFSSRLHELFELIEYWVEVDNAQVIRWAEIEREREQQQRNEAARQRALWLQDRRAKRLNQELSDWQHAGQLREYVEALEHRLEDLSEDERARIAEWLEWARVWADHIDPTVSTRRIRGLEQDGDLWY